MAGDDYRRALDAAVREYETLIADRAALDERIAQLRHSIGALTKLCGLEPTVPLGLTDACRLVLRHSTIPLTTLEVRDQIEAIGMDLEKYSNPLASIHTVLRRLHESGEIVERDREDADRTAYASVTPGLGIDVTHGKRRVRGQGLTPPKDRTK